MSTAAAIVTHARRTVTAILVILLITVGYVSSAGKSSRLDGAPSGSVGDVELTAAVSARACVPAAFAVFKSINVARHKAGLPPLKWINGLYRSASGHSFQMARTNVLSHQLPHEASFDRRISAQRVHWTVAGENIGWTSVTTTAGAVGVNAAMLNERAPHDGHRRNILSRSYTGVGINVVYDATHHRMWVTEDFIRG